ncbi:MAG: hypothetical protein WCP43_03780 [Dehalococcoidia bacterium]|jgi:hypothetical protein
MKKFDIITPAECKRIWWTSARSGISSVANPIPRNRDIYSELYNRIYKKTYGRQEPLFKELLDIAEMFPEEMK